MFTPGMFARVQVPGSAPYEALLVPDSAIGTEQARKFVLVVGADNVAALRIRDARATRRRACASSSRASRPTIGSSSPA